MKKVIASTVLLGLVFSVSSVFAEVGIQALSAEAPVPTLYANPVVTSVVVSPSADVVIPQTPEVTSVLPVIEKAEVIKITNLTKMKARGLQLIKDRINSLNANATPIANSKGLTIDQKSAFASFFNGKIADLNAVGVKIASSTDATTTKSLSSSIFTDFRIYGVLIPQLRLEKRIYELQNHATKLSTDTFVKVQTRIDEFKAKGKDVTVWQKNLDDTKTLVASGTQKLSTLLIQINALQPSNYGTTSKATIESVNKNIRMIAQDFQSINKKVKRPIFLRIMPTAVKNNLASTTEAR
jgi:hypothetical protein